jgi:2-polyprenyl-3-methyl-5-hydroxy-6-metoxy-1,4-benzoquinol methylase
MDISDKRTQQQALDVVALGNRRWWTEHAMSYDWTDAVRAERFSAAWFDEIDRRFIDAARLFAHDQAPFDRIIPFDSLKDRTVLEIGCGMGLHSELMAKAGARITALDVSDTSVEAAQRRAALKGLAIDVRQGDAAAMDFPDNHFDFVWSWGAIHHAATTGRIVRQIHRVLKPGGQARVMVYNIEGMPAYVTFVRRHLLGFWRAKSLDRALWADTDGFSARYYTRDTLADLFNTFFEKTSVEVYGQEADAIPLPRRLRALVRPLFSDDYLKRKVRERGGFLFITATK